MTKHSLILLFLVLWTFFAKGQNNAAQLLLQSPDGKNVKLIWFFKSWQKDITGFDIKRRAGTDNWEKLNDQPIVPGISAQKDLTIVTGDKSEAGRLSAKLAQLIQSNKLHEIAPADYMNKMASDTNAIKALAFMIAMDYDVALINGFAFEDNTKKQRSKLEYGLFNTANGTQLASTMWNYGDMPDLNVVSDIKIKKTARKNKLEIIWKADPTKMQTAYIAGFDLYRNDQKLNSGPVMAIKDQSQSLFSYFDSLTGSDPKATYTIKAVSIFGIEGQGQKTTFESANYPDAMHNAAIDTIITPANTNEITVQWSFPKDQDKYIKGFVVEKDNMPLGFKRVSDLLPANNRSFTDRSATKLAAYIRIRVSAIYNTDDTVSGNEKLFYYLPAIKPARPKNLIAKTEVTTGKKCVVKLQWDAKDVADSITDFYQLYASDPLTGKFLLEAGIPPIRENRYTYPLDYNSSSKYRFCISAIGKTMTESELSDTAFVVSPTLELPIPGAPIATQDSNMVLISWSYPDIADLKSFRVFQNNNMVVSEFEYGKNFRQFKTPALKWNTSYNFSIQAVTESGVVSEVSVPATVIVMKKHNP